MKMFRNARQFKVLWCIQVLIIWALLLIPIPATEKLTFSSADKLVHIGLFFWLTVSALRLWCTESVMWCLFLLALLTELSQAIAPWRTAEMLDVAANVLGICLAKLIWRWQRRRPP